MGALRFISLTKNKKKPEDWPPSENALYLHACRANQVAYMYRQALTPRIQNSLEGFEIKEGKLLPIYLTQMPFPEVKELQITCTGSTCADKRCRCFAANLKCIPALCSCTNCANK